MKWVVVYIAVCNGADTYEYSAKFAGSWLANMPGIDCQLVVACNGGPLTRGQAELFRPLNALFFPRPNDEGYDLTAYMDVAMKVEADAMCCCGQSVWFHRSGWLARYNEAWSKFGSGMYGTFSSNLLRPHLNTTGFVIAPKFLLSSKRPQNKKDRYDFEHGENSVWRRLNNLGLPTKLVTWTGIYEPHHWRLPENCMWKGDQSDCLMRCKWTDLWDEKDADTKARWTHGADFGGTQL